MSIGIGPVVGAPGPQTAIRATFLNAFWGGNAGWMNIPGGIRVHGAIARDPANTGYLDVLRPGVLLGLASSGSYAGYYGASIIGVTAAAKVATDTSVTVSAASAVELVRRVGSTGTLRFVGPPTAGGTVATFTETYSAVNTTTGVITCSGLDADLIAGSFVCANDGTYIPKTFIAEPASGQKVTSLTDTDVGVDIYRVPVAGEVDMTKFLPYYPTDTALMAWIVAQLNAAQGGHFTFKHYYV